MEKDKDIKRLRKNEMIDDYLNQQHPNLISEAKNRWQQCSQEISVFIKHDDIDLLHLAAIVDVLRNNWRYEQQLFDYHQKLKELGDDNK